MAVSFLRRRTLDPFSDAARFPTLASADDQIADAGAQHAAAVAGGPNSVAARFDPTNNGSIFSRQQPGAFDAVHDAQLRADPSNNYYNGMPRRGDTTIVAPQTADATDRYALDTGYQTADSLRGQQGLSSIDRYAIDTQQAPSHAPGAPNTPAFPSLRKRIAAGSASYDGT